jgi:hypothetical protein
MAHRRDTDRQSNGRRWLPPIPVEHGARSMLAIALLTPVSVALGGSVPDADAVIGYLAFAVFGVTALLFREAVRRSLDSPPAHRSRYTAFAVAEAVVLLASTGALAWLDGPTWGLLVLAIPGVLADIRIRRRGWPVPLGGVLVGVVSLSLVVPAGAILLGVGSLQSTLALFALFVAFHLASVLRVKTALGRDGDGGRRTLVLDVAFHAGLLTVAVAGWQTGVVGAGAPVLFLVASARAAWLVGRSEAPGVRALGRGERAFSLALLVVGPWLLP